MIMCVNTTKVHDVALRRNLVLSSQRTGSVPVYQLEDKYCIGDGGSLWSLLVFDVHDLAKLIETKAGETMQEQISAILLACCVKPIEEWMCDSAQG